MSLFLENSGEGRRYRFHGAFGTKAAAERKERATPGGFIRETMIGRSPRYVVMSPKPGRRNPTARRAKSARRVASTASGGGMAKRSRRRKSAARRKSRRRHAGVALSSNPPRRARRRGRTHARRNAPRRHGRRGIRRNPPGIVGALTDGLMDGAKVTGGVVAQNLGVRYIPDLLPATMANAPLLNGLLKDVVLIVAGAYSVHKVFDRDTARMVVAGQSFAAIRRALIATNVPVLSTSLGEYDPMRLSGMGIYTRGLPTPVPANRLLPAGGSTNVRRMAGVGIYTDGMSSAPAMF